MFFWNSLAFLMIQWMFYEVTITLIPKPDKDAAHEKKKLQANITDEHRCKNPYNSERRFTISDNNYK